MTGNTITYVTNVKTGETTRYNGFAFDHVLKFRGKHYGIKATGIYLLEGVTNDGVQIASSFRTAKNDFETSLLKRVPYLFVDCDTDTQVTPFINDVQKDDYVSGYQGKRTKLGRGLNGRYWAFQFSSYGGVDMRIRGVEIETEVMTRRIS